MVFGNTIEIVIKARDEFSKTLDRANVSLNDFTRTAKVAGAAITGFGIAGAFAIKSVVQQAGKFEQTKTAFTTMLGSEKEALETLKELTDFAAKTPFTITGVEQNAKQLLAMGIEVENIIPTLNALGNVASGLSVPLEQIAFNFGQVKAQGKLTGVELRDFARAGVPLIAELAKNLNVTEAEIKEMVSEGAIGFDDVEKAFMTMSGEGGKFFDLMKKQSKTFLGQVSNIQDSLIKISRVMGEVLLPIAKKVAIGLQELIGFMEQHPTISRVAIVLIAVSTALALIIGPLLILIGFLPALITGFSILIGVITAFATPILIAIGVIAALIAIGVLLWKNLDLIKEKGAALLNFLKKWFAPQIIAFRILLKLFGLMWDFIWKTYIQPWWSKMKDLISWIKSVALPIIKNILSTVGSVIGKIAETRQDVANRMAKAAGVKQVGDFILRPNGQLIETSPNDTIIGTKNPAMGMIININGPIQGVDAEDISKALSDELNNKVSL